MMKRMLSIVITAALVMSMVGCGKKAADNKVPSQTAKDAATVEKADDAQTVGAGEASEKKLGEIKSLKDIDASAQPETAAGGVITVGDVANAGTTCVVQADFINDTPKNINQLYIATWNDPQWGKDILGDYQLAARKYDTIFFYAYGSEVLYDVYVIFEDGTTATFTECNLTDEPITGFTFLLEDEGSDYALSHF